MAAGRSKSPSRTRSNSWDCRTRRNRLPKAVQRTTPIALVLYSLTVLWFHRTGHCYVKLSGPSVVPQEARTLVRRHVEHTSASELARQTPGCASQAQSVKKSNLPNAVLCQSQCVIPHAPRLFDCSGLLMTAIGTSRYPVKRGRNVRNLNLELQRFS